jgi:DNA-directed RNA polymerase beta' subunit
MSLRCQNFDCSRLADYECTCDRRLRLCEFHFREHGALSGCYANSIKSEVYSKSSKVQHALHLLQSSKADVHNVVNSMITELSNLLSQITRDINARAKVLKGWLKQGTYGDVDHVMGLFRYSSFRQLSVDAFIEQTRNMLTLRIANDLDTQLENEQITADDYKGEGKTAQLMGDKDLFKAFQEMELRDKLNLVEKTGISLKDVKNDVFDVKISRDKEFVLVCMVYADCER